MKVVATALALTMLAPSAIAGCAEDPAPCQVADGAYHLALPDAPQAAPVVVFLHGAGSSGAAVIGNTALVQRFVARGYAVLAPSALPRRAGASGGVWTFLPDWEGRDEAAFLRRVVGDAAQAHGLSDSRVLLTGFSAGAFMVSYLACEAPESFAAYAPLAGAFWQPHPASCRGPVKLFQTHGWRDRTVPLEGRPLRGGAWLQGDVFASLEIWRRANDCPNMAPDAFDETGIFWRRAWTDCADGSALELALHPGGHTLPSGWVDMVLDWFEAQLP